MPVALEWNPDPFVVVPLVAMAWSYGQGTRRVWRKAGRGRAVRVWQVWCFSAGTLALVVALVSPLDIMADALFSAHMAQHLLLIAVAAPLLALGNPRVALLWSMARSHRTLVGRINYRYLTLLPLAFALHSLALWIWHVPALYETALAQHGVHALEHVVLLGSGWLFWSAAFDGLLHTRRNPGLSILAVFALGAQCTGLGALITLSNRLWYASYATTTTVWGLTPMDDQALAGALMWVPAGFAYLAFALLLLGAWLSPYASSNSPIAPAASAPASSVRMPPNHTS